MDGVSSSIMSSQPPPQADVQHRKSSDSAAVEEEDILLEADELVHPDTNQLVPGSGIDLRRRSSLSWGFSSDEESQGHRKRSRTEIPEQIPSNVPTDSEDEESSVLDNTLIPDTTVSSDSSFLDASVNGGLAEEGSDIESQFSVMDSMSLASALTSSSEVDVLRADSPEESVEVVATLELELSAQLEVSGSSDDVAALEDTRPPVSPLFTSSQLVAAGLFACDTIELASWENSSFRFLDPFDPASQSVVSEESINGEPGEQFSLDASLHSFSSVTLSDPSDQEVPLSSEDELASRLEDERRRQDGERHSCRMVPDLANEE